MSMTQIFLLAIIQGVTEFLPVSSSGHLNLLHGLTDLPDQGIIIDVAVHAGTLLAVMIYFRHDVLRLLHGGIEILSPQSAKKPCENKSAAIQIIIATLPILPVGALLVLTGWIDLLRDPKVVAWATIIFALPLFLADHFRQSNISVAATGWRGAAIIGCAQIFALIPGASRAGVTITAARTLGCTRQDAARFSMLLSIPVIVIFAGLGLMDLIVAGDLTLMGNAALAAVLAAATALVSIHLFMKMTAKLSLLPFVLYRLVLGASLLYIL
ncbi:domain containing protein [Candidatus Micropelagos thuwalensis]|uniref:Undecaprenyl-diphosphatase n=2 Tax=Candidatus Micropelagius thuwalensis TaxID=1397666 RepID=U2XVG2_9PROT|nr:domain containing protein [Candidatus Micropelagos thuwalensis]